MSINEDFYLLKYTYWKTNMQLHLFFIDFSQNQTIEFNVKLTINVNKCFVNNSLLIST